MNAALQRNLLLGAVAALAVAAFAAWWMHAFERKAVEIPLPPRGEAARARKKCPLLLLKIQGYFLFLPLDYKK